MWDGSRDDDHDDNDYDGRRLADFDVINLNLMKALPLSINLTQLHTPDLIHLVRRDRRQEATRKKESQLDSQEAGKEGMLGLLQRAESIGHPELKATDVLGLFKHVSGATLKALEILSRRGFAAQDHLACSEPRVAQDPLEDLQLSRRDQPSPPCQSGLCWLAESPKIAQTGFVRDLRAVSIWLELLLRPLQSRIPTFLCTSS